eukprot:TRINITY_DN2615_c0_g1_i1.p1 TRINITY_DN2615_c0_g1~~TRINITY_DN2615_c0_g1_i1.p1  ORF type:complete len:192 (+),score=46.18 TRINITY_DN2615_c0_g1_i1:153-728(+)
MCIRDRYQRRVRGHQSSNMADTLVELLKRVQSAADACGKGDEVTLNPGADEETMAELKEIEVAVPEQVRALLAYTNGARVFDMWVPSTEEMVEHWGYNEAYPPVYTRHKALPWGMIDYDFCWRVLDREGRVWLVDGECEQVEDSGTLEGMLECLVKQLEDKVPSPSVEAADKKGGRGLGHQVWRSCQRTWG